MLASEIKLISFDLDDTLFDNRPIIQLAEEKSRTFLASECEQQGVPFEVSQLMTIRNQLIKENDLGLLDKTYFFDDLGLLRKMVLEKFCQPLSNSSEIAQQTYQLFIDYRQKITIEPYVIKMMRILSEKYRLVSISNGNSEPKKTVLGPFLQAHYSPELQLKAKPDPAMLKQVLVDFGLESNQLLHVGDSLQSDGQAAKNLDCGFYHLSPFQTTTPAESIIEQFMLSLNLTLKT